MDAPLTNFDLLFLWGVQIVWSVVALVAFLECLLEWSADRTEYRWALRIGNGRVLVARARLRTATCFLGVATCALFSAASALRTRYLQFFTEEIPMPNHTQIQSSIVTSLFLVGMLILFWLGKRSARSMRHEARGYE
jgi:hypothetical protein